MNVPFRYQNQIYTRKKFSIFCAAFIILAILVLFFVNYIRFFKWLLNQVLEYIMGDY